MFEAYKIGVRVSLVNNMSSGLLLITKQLGGAQNATDALNKRLEKTHRLMQIGAVMAGAGAIGLGIIAKMAKPAEEYVHQLNIMNMAGLKHADMVAAIGDAWKNTGAVITTTATENLRSLLDLRNVLGNMDEARMALPIVSRIQAVLAASSEGQISGNSKELAYSMAKALDIIGAAQDKQSFERQAEMMAKVVIATQGRVTPESFKSTFQYARQAKYRLSDEFKYEILPSLIQENAAGGGGGGGSRGVGPMLSAFYRFANQGYINKKSMPELIRLGLLDPSTALRTTTSGTTVGSLAGSDLAAANPFAWVQTILVPALQRKYGNLSRDQLMAHIGEITRGNQLAANLIGEFAFKPVNFLRDQANIRGTMSTSDAYKAALGHDPNTAMKALSSQWENFKISFAMGVIPVLVPALIKLSKWFNELGSWARANPTLVKTLALGFTALFGAMALGGVVMVMTAAFQALGLALGVFNVALLVNPISLVLTAAAAAVYLLYRNWDKVKPYWDQLLLVIKGVGFYLEDKFTPLWQKFKGVLFDIYSIIKPFLDFAGHKMPATVMKPPNASLQHPRGSLFGSSIGSSIAEGWGDAVIWARKEIDVHEHHTHVYLDGKKIADHMFQTNTQPRPSRGQSGLNMMHASPSPLLNDLNLAGH